MRYQINFQINNDEIERFPEEVLDERIKYQIAQELAKRMVSDNLIKYKRSPSLPFQNEIRGLVEIKFENV